MPLVEKYGIKSRGRTTYIVNGNTILYNTTSYKILIKEAIYVLLVIIT